MRSLSKKILCVLLCFAFPFLAACRQSAAPPPLPQVKISLYSPDNPPPSAPKTDAWENNPSPQPVSKNRKLIALTFDDAPRKTLENILAVFAAYNEQNPDCPASATVFFNARNLTSTQLPLLQTAYAMGFELGNHTASHANLTKLTPKQIKREIDSVDAILSKIDGQERHLFRAPFGLINDDVKQAVQTPIINWTIDTLDWTGISENEIIRAVLSQKFNGAIVLMHDGYTPTVSALKALLPALKAENYQAVTLSQMAKSNGVYMQNGGVYIRLRPQQ